MIRFSALCVPMLACVHISSAQQSVPDPSRFIKNLDAGKSQTVVAFGTSLTAGGAWVGLLDAFLKDRYPGQATVFNEGASGHSSKYGLQIIGNVTRHKPDLVLVEFAMNDSYYPERDGYKEGVPVDTSMANLKRIIDSVKAANPGCEVIPQTMDLPLGIHRARRPNLEAYYRGYRSVAAEGGLSLIDHEPNWKSILEFDSSFYVSWVPDSIHPNAAGSGAITAPAVLSALTGMSIGLDAPQARAVYASGAEIGIQVHATTGGTRVDFYDGKTRLGSDSTYPYSFVWKGAKEGRHLVMARLIRKETAVAITDLRFIEVKAVTGMAFRQARSGAGLTGTAATHGADPFRAGMEPPEFWLGRKTGASR